MGGCESRELCLSCLGRAQTAARPITLSLGVQSAVTANRRGEWQPAGAVLALPAPAAARATPPAHPAEHAIAPAPNRAPPAPPAEHAIPPAPNRAPPAHPAEHAPAPERTLNPTHLVEKPATGPFVPYDPTMSFRMDDLYDLE